MRTVCSVEHVPTHTSPRRATGGVVPRPAIDAQLPSPLAARTFSPSPRQAPTAPERHQPLRDPSARFNTSAGIRDTRQDQSHSCGHS